MKVVYFHQYPSTRYRFEPHSIVPPARRLVGRGHKMLTVCGSAAWGQTGLSVPFTQHSFCGSRSKISVVGERVSIRIGEQFGDLRLADGLFSEATAADACTS